MRLFGPRSRPYPPPVHVGREEDAGHPAPVPARAAAHRLRLPTPRANRSHCDPPRRSALSLDLAQKDSSPSLDLTPLPCHPPSTLGQLAVPSRLPEPTALLGTGAAQRSLPIHEPRHSRRRAYVG